MKKALRRIAIFFRGLFTDADIASVPVSGTLLERRIPSSATAKEATPNAASEDALKPSYPGENIPESMGDNILQWVGDIIPEWMGGLLRNQQRPRSATEISTGAARMSARRNKRVETMLIYRASAIP